MHGDNAAGNAFQPRAAHHAGECFLVREDANALGQIFIRPVIRDDLDVMGVDHLGDSGVVIRVRLKTEPSQHWAVAREMNRRIKRRFDELRIEFPIRSSLNFP